MKKTTLKLFEYLLAAKNSSLPASHHLNEYAIHCFLDEIMSLEGVRFVNHEEDGSHCLEISKQDLALKEVETSPLLISVLELLQLDVTLEVDKLITVSQLEEILVAEHESLKKKVMNKNRGRVILNDWQQLLLGAKQVQLPTKDVLEKLESLADFIQSLLKTYKEWKDDKQLNEANLRKIIRAQELYEHFLDLDGDQDKKLYKLELGIGILSIPSEPSIYHPLLKLTLELIVNSAQKTCQLWFRDDALRVENELLEHVLFYDFEGAKSLCSEINKQRISPFDDQLVARVLQKMIVRIHPEGKYCASSVDLDSDKNDVPLILHRPVLFERKMKDFDSNKQLKSAIDYLSKNSDATDILNSIVDPDYVSNRSTTFDFWLGGMNNPLFIKPTNGIEPEIIKLLATHEAVAVFEEEGTNHSHALINLITHLMSLGKRTLVVGESSKSLHRISEQMPSYLKGLHASLYVEADVSASVQETIRLMIDEKGKYKNVAISQQKLLEALNQVELKITELRKKVVDYREIGGKRIFWQSRRYYPYELAQVMTKLNSTRPVSDKISMHMQFPMNDADLRKLWELRLDFAAENLELLKYEFLDIDEILNHHEYKRLLTIEEKYIGLITKHPGLESMFDKDTDIRFIQYLFDQLPRLIKDVAEVKKGYEEQLLMKAMSSFESYNDMIASIDKINETIEELGHFKGPSSSFATLLKGLNQLVHDEDNQTSFLVYDNRTKVVDYYLDKRTQMIRTLRVAHLIWIFNEEAIALSKDFKGIKAEGLEVMSALYHAAGIYLCGMEIEMSWLRLRSYFIRAYQSVIQKENMHPICHELYETLKFHHLAEFKDVLKEMENLIIKRQNFVAFGEFVEKIGEIMPNFTASMLKETINHQDEMPDFKGVFEYSKLNTFFEILSEYEENTWQQELGNLESQKRSILQELLRSQCWDSKVISNQKVMLEVADILQKEIPYSEREWEKILSVFSTWFVAFDYEQPITVVNPDLFDVVIFIDADRSNVFRLPELLLANKAILFGKGTSNLDYPVQINPEVLKKLSNRFGYALDHFGEQYLSTSLLDLVAHSAAWEAHVKLSRDQDRVVSSATIGVDVKVGLKRCDNRVEEDIFEALVKLGYQVKCKVKISKTIIDFLVVGKTNVLAINVIGDAQMQREIIENHLNQEIKLREGGLAIYNLQAAHFYLNSRQILRDLCAKLEEMSIYPQS